MRMESACDATESPMNQDSVDVLCRGSVRRPGVHRYRYPEQEQLRPGTRVTRRYSILRTLRQHERSIVYLAEDRRRHRRVAIKAMRLPAGAIPAELLDSEAWSAPDAFLLHHLRHPLSPTLYRVFREDGEGWAATGWLPAVTRRGSEWDWTVLILSLVSLLLLLPILALWIHHAL